MWAKSAAIAIVGVSVIVLGTLPASAEIRRIPAPPTDLTLQSTVTGQVGRSITVRWRDVSTNEGGFAIERRVRVSRSNWQVVHRVVRARPAGSTQDPSVSTGQAFSWTDDSVVSGVEYCYRVKALGTDADAATREQCIVTEGGLADLTVLSGSIYKGRGYAHGDPSYVTIKIKNAGMVFARDFYVRITGRLPGRTGFLEDVEINFPIDQLNAGTERALKQFLDIGDVKHIANCCSLRIEVDPDNRIPEGSNEANNRLFLTTQDPSGPWPVSDRDEASSRSVFHLGTTAGGAWSVTVVRQKLMGCP